MNSRNLLSCVSLGALTFILYWYDQLGLNVPTLNYYRNGPPDRTYLCATIALTLGAAAFYWIAWRTVVASGSAVVKKLAQSAFLLLLSLALEMARVFLRDYQMSSSAAFNAGALVTELSLAAGVVLLWRGNPRIVFAARNVTAMMSVLIAVMLADFGRRAILGPQALAYAAATAPEAAVPAPAAQRVALLIFDELDQDLAIDARPASLEMPELDRLAAGSFRATAVERAGPRTDLAIPGLTTGRRMVEAEGLGPSQLRVTPEAGEAFDWRSASTLFHQAARRGHRTGLTGWYHPYCRLFGEQTADCYSETFGEAIIVLRKEQQIARRGFLGGAAELLRIHGGILRQTLTGGSVHDAWNIDEKLERVLKREQFERFRQRALRQLSQPSLDLVYSHWPVPHPPGIYDRKSGRYSAEAASDYLDNLALLDRTLGEVRQTMERAGTWEDTTLIVTADHNYRPEEWAWLKQSEELARALGRLRHGNSGGFRVPLVIKFPRQSQPVAYGAPFSSLLLHDFVLEVLQGRIGSAEAASKWFDANRGRIALATRAE